MLSKIKTIELKIKCKLNFGNALILNNMLINITHELIGPQTTNILLQTWGLTMSQEVFIFLIIGPKVFCP